MVDRHPVELCSQIHLHLTGEISSESPDVFHLGSVFRGDDETEVMSILPAALDEDFLVGMVALGVKHGGSSLISGYALSLEIGQMLSHWRRTKGFTLMTCNPSLDRHASGCAGEE